MTAPRDFLSAFVDYAGGIKATCEALQINASLLRNFITGRTEVDRTSAYVQKAMKIVLDDIERANRLHRKFPT